MAKEIKREAITEAITRCVIKKDGELKGHVFLDTVFAEGVPHVVFEWAVGNNGIEKPRLIVQLDPEYFYPLQDWKDATHIYHLPIEDPRASK